MSAVSEFVKNPVTFLENNIVLQMVAGTGVHGTTGSFTLRPTSKTGYLPGGGSCPVYEMHTGSGSESFTAYWCPYEDDKVRSVTLGSAANLMFTAKMTGCSFGVGIPGSDGSVRVAHSNSQESDALQQIADAMYQAFDPKAKGPSKAMGYLECKKTSVKSQEQGGMLISSKGVDGTLSTEINPSLYRGLIATTFGIRDGKGKWTFHFHAFAQEGSVFKLYGCFPFPNQT